MNKPIAVDLFAGCGGLSLGVELAGFEVRVAVEKQEQHVQIHEQNFPECSVILADIKEVQGGLIKTTADTDEIHLLCGGPPCQAFSSDGKQREGDERSLLVWEYARLVEELQPRYFIFENVAALATKKFQKLFYELLRRFYDLGYQTTHKVLNAQHYGVPQDRDRLIVLGSRSEFVRFPKPLITTPKVWDAIGDLPEPQSTSEDALSVELFGEPSLYASTLRDSNLTTVSGFLKTNHSEEVQERFLTAAPGKKEAISRFHKLNPNGVCCTLKAGTTTERGSHTAARPIHPHSPRVITVREAARLHSYPDWFKFHPSKHWGFMQVGNSVPPSMGKAIAQQIYSLCSTIGT